MLPNAATYMRTIRDTADPIAQDKPLDIGDRVWMNNPNRDQFLSWAMANALPTEVCKNSTFGHLEDSPFPNWVTFTGATETSQLTTGLTIDNVFERCAAGQILMCARDKQIMRLTADPASADTTGAVARCFGRGASTDYLRTGDKLLLLTPQMYEGFTTGKPQSGVDVYKSFTTGIVSEPISATYSEETDDYYHYASPFERDLDKTWIRIKDQMESGLVFAAQKLDTTTYAQNMHTYSGLYDFIETNVYSIDGTMSRMDFFDILLEHGLYHKESTGILCSSFFRQMLTEWAYGQMEYDQEAKQLGMDIRQINLNGTIYDLIECDKLSQDWNLMGMVFLCPKGKLRHRPKQDKNGIVNSIHYAPIARDEVHCKEGEIWGEFGWEFYEEETWALIEGIEF